MIENGPDIPPEVQAVLEPFQLANLRRAQRDVDAREGDPAKNLPWFLRVFPGLQDAARGIADVQELIHQDERRKEIR
ncbi:MAG TPA: hypothetical protein VFQ63_04100 [Patescibacteria group bacterium]|nr:hypothetical protein [Patescibacteria group bacterium]